MARTKHWTIEDRDAALDWMARKAKTGAIFHDQDEAGENMLLRFAAITDPQGFAIAAQEALTDAAWKRLLGALRQRKHQDQTDATEDQAGEHGAQEAAQAGACASCARLQAQVDRLTSRLERKEHDNFMLGNAIETARNGKPAALARKLRESITGDAWQALISELGNDHQAEDTIAVMQDRFSADNKEDLEQVAKAMAGLIGSPTEAEQAGPSAPAPAPAAPASDRDQTIMAMVEAGVSYRAIGRKLGISDSTVRAAVKRHRQKATA